LLAVTLPWFFATLGLGVALERRFAAAGTAAAVSLAYATPWFAFGGMLFAHGFSGAAVCAATLLALGSQPTKRAPVAAGLAMGWAVTAEYPLAVVAVLLAGAVFLQRSRNLVWFGLGAFSPALALALCNAACFGAPWSLSSAQEVAPACAALSQQGLFGIGLPAGEGFWLLLLSPERGLLAWAPLLLFGFIPPTKTKDALPWFCWLASVAQLCLMAGYPNAHGGWCPGPRYLVATFPLLA